MIFEPSHYRKRHILPPKRYAERVVLANKILQQSMEELINCYSERRAKDPYWSNSSLSWWSTFFSNLDRTSISYNWKISCKLKPVNLTSAWCSLVFSLKYFWITLSSMPRIFKRICPAVCAISLFLSTCLCSCGLSVLLLLTSTDGATTRFGFFGMWERNFFSLTTLSTRYLQKSYAVKRNLEEPTCWMRLKIAELLWTSVNRSSVEFNLNPATSNNLFPEMESPIFSRNALLEVEIARYLGF